MCIDWSTLLAASLETYPQATAVDGLGYPEKCGSEIGAGLGLVGKFGSACR